MLEAFLARRRHAQALANRVRLLVEELCVVPPQGIRRVDIDRLSSLALELEDVLAEYEQRPASMH